MKDLLSKEHCCYKTHVKSNAYLPPPSIDNPLYMDYPPFLKENLEPTFYDFQKSQPLCQ